MHLPKQLLFAKQLPIMPVCPCDDKLGQESMSFVRQSTCSRIQVGKPAYNPYIFLVRQC